MKKLLHIPSATIVDSIRIYNSYANLDMCSVCKDIYYAISFLNHSTRSSAYQSDIGMLCLADHDKRFVNHDGADCNYMEVLPEHLMIVEVDSEETDTHS